MESIAQAIEAFLGAKAAAKVCAFLGAGLVVFGWLRGRAGRAIGRSILALSDEESTENRLNAMDSRLDSVEVALARLESRLDWRDKRVR